jgi:hypothetical protein
VFERVRVLWRRADARVHGHGGNCEHLLKHVQQENPPSVKNFAFLICWDIVPLDFILCNVLQTNFRTYVHRTFVTHIYILNLSYHLWLII